MKKRQHEAMIYLAQGIKKERHQNQLPIARKLAAAWLQSMRVKWYRWPWSIEYKRSQGALIRAISAYQKDLMKRAATARTKRMAKINGETGGRIIYEWLGGIDQTWPHE